LNKTYQQAPGSRMLMLAGLLLAFSSLFGFIVEWRMRSLKPG
jgi:hypothetical protein